MTTPLRSVPSLVLALLATGCSDHAARKVAVQDAFASYQRSLLTGDRRGLSRILTRDSRPAIDQLPLAELGRKDPLEVVGVEGEKATWRVRVHDPNPGGTDGVYLVVRQDGEWRIDLLGSLAQNHAVVHGEGSGMQVVPADVDPREIDGIRAAPAAGIR